MGEILPDGTIQGYFHRCPKCGKTVSSNIQGHDIGGHTCEICDPEACEILEKGSIFYNPCSDCDLNKVEL